MKTLAATQSTTTSAATPPPSAFPSLSAVLNPQSSATGWSSAALGEGDDARDADRERDGPGQRLSDRAFLLDGANARLCAEAAAEHHVLPERDRLVGDADPPPAAELGVQQHAQPEGEEAKPHG